MLSFCVIALMVVQEHMIFAVINAFLFGVNLVFAFSSKSTCYDSGEDYY